MLTSRARQWALLLLLSSCIYGGASIQVTCAGDLHQGKVSPWCWEGARVLQQQMMQRELLPRYSFSSDLDHPSIAELEDKLGLYTQWLNEPITHTTAAWDRGAMTRAMNTPHRSSPHKLTVHSQR